MKDETVSRAKFGAESLDFILSNGKPLRGFRQGSATA